MRTVALSAAACLHGAWAWFDEGHMLVVAVARRYVKDPELFDRVLQAQPEFANFNDMVSASTWADHVSCSVAGSGRLPYCKGLDKPADFQSVKPFHFVDITYNPLSYKVPFLERLMPYYKLDRAYFQRDAVSFLKGADQIMRGGTQSVWSWNFYLRLFLHVFGDLHQPLHTGSFFSKYFPDGDMGGNKILLNVSCLRPELHDMANLHLLWDSGGGAWGRYIPEVDPSMLEAEVDRLTKKYPPGYFVDNRRLDALWNEGNMTKTKTPWGLKDKDEYGNIDTFSFFDETAHDSWTFHSRAYTEVRSERPLGPYLQRYADAYKYNSKDKWPDELFCPSADYLTLVKRISSSQVALGGYRLSSLLNSLAANVPKVDLSKHVVPSGNKDNSWSSSDIGVNMACLCGGTFLGCIIMFFLLKATKRQPHWYSAQSGFLERSAQSELMNLERVS